MSAVSLPKFRLSRTITLGEEGFDVKFIHDLIGMGFKCEAVNGNGSAPRQSAGKTKRKRRRRANTPLTKERVREFQKARQEGKSYRRIGSIFGVSEGRAWQIINKGK